VSRESLQVRDADRGEFESVLRLSHEVWGDGMSLDDYIRFNIAQTGTAWGLKRYRVLAGVEADGAVACSMKLFSLPVELDGRPALVAGVGAVFTHPGRRGRGLALELVEGALARARTLGHEAALLMSEIGGDYYARIGFGVLPAAEAGCLPFLPVPWPGEPAWLRGGNIPGTQPGLRPYKPEDLDALVLIHEEATRGQRFRLLRDRAAWEHLLVKLSLGHRLRRDGEDLIWVVERGGEVAAYAVLKETRAALLWKEHGARLGAEEALADLFWSALAHARVMGVNRLDAWHLPAIVTTRRLYPIAVRPQRDPVVMMRFLDARHPPPAFAAPEECRISWLDQF
jgi:GNAT superfamily N-acetyltransferase